MNMKKANIASISRDEEEKRRKNTQKWARSTRAHDDAWMHEKITQNQIHIVARTFEHRICFNSDKKSIQIFCLWRIFTAAPAAGMRHSEEWSDRERESVEKKLNFMIFVMFRRLSLAFCVMLFFEWFAAFAPCSNFIPNIHLNLNTGKKTEAICQLSTDRDPKTEDWPPTGRAATAAAVCFSDLSEIVVFYFDLNR